MDIYALRVGLRYGPYSEEELHEQVVRGFFAATNFASADGGHTWCTIAELDHRSPSQNQPAPRLSQPWPLPRTA